jgi:hypothetical protein
MLFASPDFGAGGGALLIQLALGVTLLAVVSGAIVGSIALLRRESTQERRRGVLIGACLAAGLAGTYYSWQVFHTEPRRDLESLLAGDRHIELASLTIITGQQQRIEVSDPASLRYLGAALRSAVKEGYSPSYHGLPYYAEMGFGKAGSVLVCLAAAEDADGVTVCYPIVSYLTDGYGDPFYYWVRLPEPIPTPVSEVLDRMRHPPR